MDSRLAETKDEAAIVDVIKAAFPEDESTPIAKLAIDLTSHQSTPNTYSVVACNAERIVGHVAYSPVSIEGMESVSAYNLAPLAVDPAFQKQGVGGALIQWGLDRLTAEGCQLLLVYGDPKYYGRFGFIAEPAQQFIPVYPLEYAFGWQALFMNGFSYDGPTKTIHCVAPLNDPVLW